MTASSSPSPIRWCGLPPPATSRRAPSCSSMNGNSVCRSAPSSRTDSSFTFRAMRCGALCLLGAIPALFITPAPDGTTRWYVLSDADGNALGEVMRAHIGERLSLTGHVVEAADLHEFRIDRQSAERVLAEASIVRP